MTYIVSSGALNSTHSLSKEDVGLGVRLLKWSIKLLKMHIHPKL